MHIFGRSLCLLCEGWTGEVEPSSRGGAVVHIGSDEILHHDSGEELERKEWTQEYLIELNKAYRTSLPWTGSIIQARAKDQEWSSNWNHSSKAQMSLYVGRIRSRLHAIMSGAHRGTTIQKYLCHPLPEITPWKQHLGFNPCAYR